MVSLYYNAYAGNRKLLGFSNSAKPSQGNFTHELTFGMIVSN